MADIWIYSEELDVDVDDINLKDVKNTLKINGAERVKHIGGGVWHFYYGVRPWTIYYLLNQYDVNNALNEIEKQLWSE